MGIKSKLPVWPADRPALDESPVCKPKFSKERFDTSKESRRLMRRCWIKNAPDQSILLEGWEGFQSKYGFVDGSKVIT